MRRKLGGLGGIGGGKHTLPHYIDSQSYLYTVIPQKK